MREANELREKVDQMESALNSLEKFAERLLEAVPGEGRAALRADFEAIRGGRPHGTDWRRIARNERKHYERVLRRLPQAEREAYEARRRSTPGGDPLYRESVAAAARCIGALADIFGKGAAEMARDIANAAEGGE